MVSDSPNANSSARLEWPPLQEASSEILILFPVRSKIAKATRAGRANLQHFHHERRNGTPCPHVSGNGADPAISSVNKQTKPSGMLGMPQSASIADESPAIPSGQDGGKKRNLILSKGQH